VLLPDTGQAGALKLKERLLKILDNQNLRSTGIPYTVSIEVFLNQEQKLLIFIGYLRSVPG